MFTLLDDNNDLWWYINLQPASTYTQFEANIGPAEIMKVTKALLFPHTWTRLCLSVDSMASKMTLVVDGQLLEETEYKLVDYRPANLTILLGSRTWWTGMENPIQVAGFNGFNSFLSLERMIELTTAVGEECRAPGELVSWEEAEWTLNSTAKMIEVDREFGEGLCRRGKLRRGVGPEFFKVALIWRVPPESYVSKLQNELCPRSVASKLSERRPPT